VVPGRVAPLGEEEPLSIDVRLFHWINNLGGHVALIDRLFAGLADDYFMIIAMCLVLVGMWFGTRNPGDRKRNQVAVLKAMASLGIASGFVAWVNVFFVGEEKFSGTLIHDIFNRPRPFVEFGTSVIHRFYQPTDPSFPSNLAAVVFGLALAVWFMNKRTGTWLLGMALVACFARIYVGIHYPSDILGGAAFGLAGVAVTYFLFWVLSPLVKLIKWLLEAFYLAG
jgi:undecaprenyl-diphosphatase